MNSVLIVEDEKHIADGLRYNLNAEGFEVETTRSGEEALAMLVDDHKTFDVLVLDVMLPGIDGFSLASKLRSLGYFVPILMLTARGQAEDVLRGFEAGAAFRKHTAAVFLDYRVHDEKSEAGAFHARHKSPGHTVKALEDPF